MARPKKAAPTTTTKAKKSPKKERRVAFALGLDKKMLEAFRKEAKRRKISVAALIREKLSTPTETQANQEPKAA